MQIAKLVVLSAVFELAVVQRIVKSSFCEKFVVVALFDDIAVFHYENHVAFSYGRKSVRYDKGRSALHKVVESVLYLHLRTGVYG